MNDWESIETAPKDRKILAWNPVTGTYVTKYKDGEWPMYGWDQPGVWFPRPYLWMPLPKPSNDMLGHPHR